MIPFDETEIQTLIKLGLNGSQAKIYLTLDYFRIATVKQIAQTAKIDRGEVYRQLEFLQRESLVEKILGVPNHYKPLVLKKAIDILLEKKDNEVAKIKQEVKVLLKNKTNSFTQKENELKISVIPPKDYRIHYAKRVYETLKKEMLWFTQIGRIPVTINSYYDSMEKARYRGVRWRTIAELDEPTDNVLQFIQKYKEGNPNFDIRFVNPDLFVTFVIFDDSELIFSTKEVKGAADSQALCTNNPQLIKMTIDYFELKWNVAMKDFPMTEAH